MGIELKISLQQLNPSIIKFYEYIFNEKSNPNSLLSEHFTIPDVNQLFEEIENEFKELHNATTLTGLLKLLNSFIQNTNSSDANYFKIIKNLVINHSSNEEDFLVAVRIIYQILHSLPTTYSFEELQKAEIAGDIFFPLQMQCEKLKTQLALCRSLLISKFNIDSLLETVWNDTLSNQQYSSLVHYIDSLISKKSIYECFEFWNLIQELLSSEIRDNRKLGIFFIRKILKCLSQNPKNVEVDGHFYWSTSTVMFLNNWLPFITILENLEEKQSHLILPSLKTIADIILPRPWKRIIFLQILKHNSSLVLRWSVEFLLTNFRNEVLMNNILLEFLNATNNTVLYSEDVLKPLKYDFLKEIDQESFLQAFTDITWKSVPMHAWLLKLREISWNTKDQNLITKLATRLRQLQNRILKMNCRKIFAEMFEEQLNAMSFQEFVNFLEAMYSSTDHLPSKWLDALGTKIKKCLQPYISANLFATLRKERIPLELEIIIMDAFENVKANDHKWCGILVTFEFSNSKKRDMFCKKHYDIQIGLTDASDASFEDLMSEYVNKLSWNETSKAVVREATIDWYTSNSKTITEKNCEKLLDGGGVKTVINIVNPAKRSFSLKPVMIDRLISELRVATKKAVNTDELVIFLIESCKADQPDLFYKYVNQILDIDVTNNHLALQVYKAALKLCNFQEPSGSLLLLRGLLYGEPLNGDSRLEYEYASRVPVSEELRINSTHKVRQICLKFLDNLDPSSNYLLKAELIEYMKNLSLRKPRYFENSKHHRLKLRGAQALAVLNRKIPVWNEYYLLSICQENNQINVTYINEIIVAETISKCELIKQMENLKNFSNSFQVSLFAISYLFVVIHSCKQDFVEKLINILLPWTMGSNFNTRLYAQITIHHLLQQFKIKTFDYLKIAIENSLTDSPNACEKLNTDIRYNFPKDLKTLNTDAILYVTVVPEDEHLSSDLEYLSAFECLSLSRNLTLAKKKERKEDVQDPQIESVIKDVQRKMNPEIILSQEKTLHVEQDNTNMIVVASLIDKLPNLGGIARTCEVLGIKHLVLDSVKHIQNKEFKNLSMTAENWINVSEVKTTALQSFLLTKKSEGYEIVGAEQTAKSVNFMNFKFPEKCVLLLGHEKEGIPADLIAILDYAVEIPQFGMVRSLNVHVTGALFMFEYCKQHLAVQR